MRRVIIFNSVLFFFFAMVFVAIPTIRGWVNIRDQALQNAGVPQLDWRLMKRLTPRYEAWAKKRISGGTATSLAVNNISGTEWPLFGSVFYLWAVENLQSAWEHGDKSAGVEPKEYCKDAIIAASELIVDTNQASWVNSHWGTNYLHHENVFYRMLVISELASRESLLHDHAHTNLLRDQVETLSKELDASASGLLDDYPGQCYPGDVMAATYAIRRADAALGTDHSRFSDRELRAFIGTHLTKSKLPPYSADAKTGRPTAESRGCGNSYFCLTGPELWPGVAKQWFENYEKEFWQERSGFDGFREYPKENTVHDWSKDVDAGPVLDGFGFAANAFGVGAARKNGRFDLAYPLSTEMLATVWELPDGALAGPRLLSDLADAPYLGEAAVMWFLSIQPTKGFPIKTGGSVPTFVYVVLGCASAVALFMLLASADRIRSVMKGPEPWAKAQGLQLALWALLLALAVAMFVMGYTKIALLLLCVATVFPRTRDELREVKTDEPPAPAQVKK